MRAFGMSPYFITWFLFLSFFWGLSLRPSSAQASTGASGEVILQQDQFVSPDYTATQQKSFSFVGLNFDTHPSAQKEDSSVEVQAKGLFAIGNPVLNYLDVKQFYWNTGSFSFGRKLENWSNLDEFFKLGMYQPNFNWNPVNPETQGLTGIFFDFKPDLASPIDYGFLIFVSPIFIPDQGASYEIQNGSFTNSSPFFHAPPQYAQVQDQTIPINYTVDKPNTNDVVFNNSYAVKGYVGDPKKGFYFQAADAYAPSNQLALAVKGGANAHSSIDAEILPAIYYHSLLSADLQYTFDNIRLGISDLYEKPEAPKFTPDWFYQTYAPSNLVSPYIQIKYKRFNFTLASLNVTGASTTSYGSNPSSDTSVESNIFDRYPYRNAVLISADYKFILKKMSSISTQLKVLQSTSNAYSAITGSVIYQYDSRWHFNLDAQVIAASDTTGSQFGNIYSYYENNDAVGLGVAYVF